MRIVDRVCLDRMTSHEPLITELGALGHLYQTPRHIVFRSHTAMQSTGSCVWNGGTTTVHGWLNLKVSGASGHFESPALTLKNYAHALDIQQPLAGMMTAASMNSLRYSLLQNHGIQVACIVTAGIENARRCGDPADENIQPGTINLALLCNRSFTPAACIEALMLMTEAKTAACYDLNILSPISQQMATGTGTDSLCLLSALPCQNTAPIEYCGKHTFIGEWIGKVCQEALQASLSACVSLQR